MRDAGAAGGYGAIVLAGGAARRLGGRPKPSLTVGGRTLLGLVLDAVADAAFRIVVGPPVTAPAGVRFTMERPPGGGPVAAAAAGLAALDEAAGLAALHEAAGPAALDRAVPEPVPYVALLAADLPFIRPEVVADLLAAVAGDEVDLALLVDDAGVRQVLCGVWRTRALRARLAERAAAGLAGTPLRHLVARTRVTEVTCTEGDRPAWFDCDTEEDLARAERWSHGDPG